MQASKTAPRALLVATAATAYKTGAPTGAWSRDVVDAFGVLRKGGYEVDLATPGGSPLSFDPRGLEADALSASGRAIMSELPSPPIVLSKADPEKYSIVYVAGGHGALFDLLNNKTLKQCIAAAWTAGAVIATCSHGAGALLNVGVGEGPLLKGRSVTCISDEEEASCALPKGALPTAKFSLSGHLQKDGAEVQHGGVWKEHVVVDGRLVRRPRFSELTHDSPPSTVQVTGQNGKSASLTATKAMAVVSGSGPDTPRGSS